MRCCSGVAPRWYHSVTGPSARAGRVADSVANRPNAPISATPFDVTSFIVPIMLSSALHPPLVYSNAIGGQPLQLPHHEIHRDLAQPRVAARPARCPAHPSTSIRGQGDRGWP